TAKQLDSNKNLEDFYLRNIDEAVRLCHDSSLKPSFKQKSTGQKPQQNKWYQQLAQTFSQC
ncbi:hypothetical protein, partial [Klebsiella pneumoniae]|uniref:hypothetical protein n=1 Tax=Klebsiella pneumoniae TaxID=573 RepID=UPI001C8F6097